MTGRLPPAYVSSAASFQRCRTAGDASGRARDSPGRPGTEPDRRVPRQGPVRQIAATKWSLAGSTYPTLPLLTTVTFRRLWYGPVSR